jgi:hypothetical protein
MRENEYERRRSGMASAVQANGLAANRETDGTGGRAVDLERLGRDQIAQLIEQRFKGREMTRLVDAIDVAGYTTYESAPGKTAMSTFSWRRRRLDLTFTRLPS